MGIKETFLENNEKDSKNKCSSCGSSNRVPVNKIFIEQNSIEAKVEKREYINIFWETPI